MIVRKKIETKAQAVAAIKEVMQSSFSIDDMLGIVHDDLTWELIINSMRLNYESQMSADYWDDGLKTYDQNNGEYNFPEHKSPTQVREFIYCTRGCVQIHVSLYEKEIVFVAMKSFKHTAAKNLLAKNSGWQESHAFKNQTFSFDMRFAPLEPFYMPTEEKIYVRVGTLYVLELYAILNNIRCYYDHAAQKRRIETVLKTLQYSLKECGDLHKKMMWCIKHSIPVLVGTSTPWWLNMSKFLSVMAMPTEEKEAILALLTAANEDSRKLAAAMLEIDYPENEPDI